MAQVLKPNPKLREGAVEVGTKLRGDLSSLGRFRRGVTLKSTMDCLDCLGTGKDECTNCNGSGKSTVVWGEEEQQCATCVGTGKITCNECAGRGFVVNPHRAKLLWIMILGTLAWVVVFVRLFGDNLFPAERAKLLNTGGGKVFGNQTTGGGRSIGRPGAADGEKSGELQPPQGIRQGNLGTGGGFSGAPGARRAAPGSIPGSLGNGGGQ